MNVAISSQRLIRLKLVKPPDVFADSFEAVPTLIGLDIEFLNLKCKTLNPGFGHFISRRCNNIIWADLDLKAQDLKSSLDMDRPLVSAHRISDLLFEHDCWTVPTISVESRMESNPRLSLFRIFDIVLYYCETFSS